jgi:hypothetical protein
MFNGQHTRNSNEMSQHQRSASAMGAQSGAGEKSYFQQQREALIGEIAMVRNVPLAAGEE